MPLRHKQFIFQKPFNTNQIYSKRKWKGLFFLKRPGIIFYSTYYFYLVYLLLKFYLILSSFLNRILFNVSLGIQSVQTSLKMS